MSNTQGDDDLLIVTADDGMMFACSLASLGLDNERRWILTDTQSTQYLGPPVGPDCSLRDVQRLVAEWWRLRHDDDRSCETRIAIGRESEIAP